jgi:osmotically-inducible protein OsmY
MPTASLHDRVHDALSSGMGAAASDIEVRVEGTMVFLSGHVGSQADHDRAHQIAHDVPGVTMVHHEELVVH